MGLPMIGRVYVSGVITLAILTTTLGTVSRAEDRASLGLRESWSSIFAGQPTTFHITLNMPRDFEGRLGWRFAVNSRTASRGEIGVSGRQATTSAMPLQLDVPDVNAGITLEATLEVRLFERAASKAIAAFDKTLWLFSKQPFVANEAWLKDLNIRLFDPPGHTRQILDRLDVPYQITRNPEAFAAWRDGVLIVGEGVSFTVYRGLFERLVHAAARGIAVLCLAPTVGEWEMPGTTTSDLPQPSAMAFHDRDIIRILDHRLDKQSWPPDGRVVVARMVLSNRGQAVIGKMTSGLIGWPWWEMHFGPGRGRFIFCGMAIIEKWEASPTPRFLLARILDHIAGRVTAPVSSP